MGLLTRFLTLIFSMGVLLSGCGFLNGAAPEEKRVPLEVLYKGSQCGAGTAAGATWIDRPQDLPAALRRSEGFDWRVEREGAVWIRMGAQPTGGFGLELAEPTAGVRRKVATIRIDWRRPAPDRFVSQAFTSPCIVIKVPRAGLRAQVALP
jgi:hypothetical protein